MVTKRNLKERHYSFFRTLCMYVGMYVCMYVCVYIYIHIYMCV